MAGLKKEILNASLLKSFVSFFRSFLQIYHYWLHILVQYILQVKFISKYPLIMLYLNYWKWKI